jgi:hypothetical protein
VARDIKLLQQTLQTNFRRFSNFLGFASGFVRRKNPLKALSKGFVQIMKEFLTLKKKLKMSQYRLHYHQHQLKRMESLIAENNQHTFLSGKNINEVR